MIAPDVADELHRTLSQCPDLSRKLFGPAGPKAAGRGRDLALPRAKEVVKLLAPALAQLAHDGTDDHHQGRQTGFWWNGDDGWQRVKITAVIDALDDVVGAALADAIEARRSVPGTIRSPGERRGAFEERIREADMRIKMIEALQRFLSSTGNPRGQFVAALRDSGDFELSRDAVREMTDRYLQTANREELRRVVAVVAPLP
jgi:hypothetical protein